jgi:hypothetical protein
LRKDFISSPAERTIAAERTAVIGLPLLGRSSLLVAAIFVSSLVTREAVLRGGR